ncbi:cell division topological specificity factor MinE [Thermanaerovibrio acidaminovorans]|jgi:cell division topological specificity factor|uniref:Cell division topological specificity factor n=1 Tax=Thermanaerovibrio acidaminovorans (strain ATCC 49978 / DSM 6589 / Su883) TaxID=525903 RepID=D1B5Z5_THEAS|nr:cell division topological specificity factor MinE [Thermanaerovibrio acidaminovorans]ACZ19436.1 cell division topological specificity factor MinE [Thermanaerovibrio acidaminovorans DSM 6589]
MGFIDRLFGGRSPSGSTAKERLQLVLIHDRSDISPEMMESLRKDLISVISKYMEIDEKKIELDLEREDRSVALVASIPVVNVRRCGRSGGSRCP